MKNKPQNPDVCFVCGKELGKLYWIDLQPFLPVPKFGISRVWVAHYKNKHPDKLEELCNK